MGMPETVRRWTRDQLLALPDDGNRYELVHGELLVRPAPSSVHQDAIAELFRRVDPYVRQYRLGKTGLAPADLDLGGTELVQPGLSVVRLLPDGRKPAEWPEYGVPILIAEVISPSTARQDRMTKREVYQARGVEQYWIVDTDARAVERWEPRDQRPEVLGDRIIWHPGGAPEPLVLDLPEYFRERWGESG